MPIHDATHYSQERPTWPQSHHDGSQVFVNQTVPFNSAISGPHQQIQPTPAPVAAGFPTLPSDVTSRPTVSGFSPQASPTRRKSRGNRFVINSPYPPTRTSSLPVQSVSRTETGAYCQWVGEDGTVCGGHITSATVSQHLTTHGVVNMTYNHLLSCRWLECQLRRDMKRESIVRHVRERHLGCKRTL